MAAAGTPPLFGASVAIWSGSLELRRELLHDAVGERIGHSQNLVEDRIERRDRFAPLTLQCRCGLIRGQSEMLIQHGNQRTLGPVGVGAAEKSRDVVRVRMPALVG